MRLLLLFSTVVLVQALSGCGDQGTLLAEQGGEKLRSTDLARLLPPGTSAADSARVAPLYIEQWKKEAALAQHALKDFPELEKEIAAQLANARHQLLARAWADRVLAANLDTSLPPADISTWYELHKAEFVVNEPYVQPYYIRCSPQEQGVFEKLSALSGKDQLAALQAWAAKNAQYAELSGQWLPQAQLAAWQAPADIAGQLGVFRYENTLNGKPTVHFLRVNNRVEAGQVLSLEAAEPRIRRLLIEKRKQQVLEKQKQKIYKDAGLE